jgi:hypothetical protein
MISRRQFTKTLSGTATLAAFKPNALWSCQPGRRPDTGICVAWRSGVILQGLYPRRKRPGRNRLSDFRRGSGRRDQAHYRIRCERGEGDTWRRAGQFRGSRSRHRQGGPGIFRRRGDAQTSNFPSRHSGGVVSANAARSRISKTKTHVPQLRLKPGGLDEQLLHHRRRNMLAKHLHNAKPASKGGAGPKATLFSRALAQPQSRHQRLPLRLRLSDSTRSCANRRALRRRPRKADGR